MKPIRLRADVLAGLTTSFALLPECIAFALVAHLNPLMGLYGAFIICTLTALFGGRPGMLSFRDRRNQRLIDNKNESN